MNTRLAVDSYFKTNRKWDDKPQYDDMNAIDQTLGYEDYDLLHGCSHDEFEDLSPRDQAYRLNQQHPENIVILFDCKHIGDKHRHHPNYNKPFEVEVLCVKCHQSRHYIQRRDTFGDCCYQHRKSRSISSDSIGNPPGT